MASENRDVVSHAFTSKSAVVRKSSSFSGFVLVAILLLAWQILSDNGILYRPYFPSPTTVLSTLMDNLRGQNPIYNLPVNLALTLYRMAFGYLLALVTAIPLGIVVGYYRAIYNLFEPLLEVLRALPPVAVTPIFIILLGVGDSMYIPFIAFGCFWPILINTSDGVKNIEPLLISTSTIFRITGLQRLRKVLLPAASPLIISGLRISLPLSLLLTIIAEMTVGRNGIGYTTIYSQQTSDIPVLYGQIFVVSLLGYVLHRIFLVAQVRLIAWRKLTSVS